MNTHEQYASPVSLIFTRCRAVHFSLGIYACLLAEFGKNKVELAFLTTVCSSGGRFVKENMNAKLLTLAVNC